MLSFDPVLFALQALATAYVAYAVSSTHLTEPFRVWVYRRSPFLSLGLSCVFCMSFWSAVAVVVSTKNSCGDVWNDALYVLAVAGAAVGFVKFTGIGAKAEKK